MMAVRLNRKHSIWLYYGASVAIILVALLLVTLYVAVLQSRPDSKPWVVRTALPLSSIEQLLEEILESCYQICRARADEKQISLTYECPASIHIFADRSLLTQAVVNLVDNAIKYSLANTRVVMRGSETGAGVQITVEDNGPGIDEHHLARLFERFYRVDKARSRKLGGTGLGLAIVKHIVSVHGGQVKVETGIGKGSTFIILLPHYQG